MGSPRRGATFTGVPQPQRDPCSVCSGAGWVWEEVEVETTTVDAGGHTTLVHWEWEQVTCHWCGGDGLEPLEHPGRYAQLRAMFRVLRSVWSSQ